MNLPGSLRRIGPVLLAFALVAGGTLLALPDGDVVEGGPERIATLVAAAPVAAGTSSADLATMVEVRLLEPDARAEGALASPDDLADGVLDADLVPGQQVLRTSVVADVVAGVGADFRAVSVRLDPQRWVGPLLTTGDTVDVFDIGDATQPAAQLISSGAVVLDAPPTEGLGAREEAVITLAVRDASLAAVLAAASADRIWLVGA